MGLKENTRGLERCVTIAVYQIFLGAFRGIFITLQQKTCRLGFSNSRFVCIKSV